MIPEKIKKILEYYDGEPTAIKSKIYQILMHGKLSGTGRMIILPVDQGFEHGPTRSFIQNPESYDPDYFFKLAIEAQLNAYAAPVGLLRASSNKFVGQIPTILKLNSNNSLVAKGNIPDQAITSSVKDALDLGCIGVGFTIYPGSDKAHDMLEEAAEIIKEARSYGLLTVIWSYARGKDLTSNDESAIDTCAYAAHIAALLGAHIIKVKLPTSEIYNPIAKKLYQDNRVKFLTLFDRVRHVMQSCFNGKRLVVFSGGPAKAESDILEELSAIHRGGGNGSIIGRNSFQRLKPQSLEFLAKASNIYLSKVRVES